MLEPSDLYAATNRLLVGLGQIVTAAALLVLVAVLAQQTGNRLARDFALLSLGFTVAGYALQLVPVPVHRLLVLTAVQISWLLGLVAVLWLILRGV